MNSCGGVQGGARSKEQVGMGTKQQTERKILSREKGE